MKKYLFFISLISLMVCCSTKKPSVEEEAVVSIQFNADSAYAFCAAQCDFGPRVMNSDAQFLPVGILHLDLGINIQNRTPCRVTVFICYP